MVNSLLFIPFLLLIALLLFCIISLHTQLFQWYNNCAGRKILKCLAITTPPAAYFLFFPLSQFTSKSKEDVNSMDLRLYLSEKSKVDLVVYYFYCSFFADWGIPIIYLQGYGLEKARRIFQHFFSPFTLLYVNFITKVL